MENLMLTSRKPLSWLVALLLLLSVIGIGGMNGATMPRAMAQGGQLAHYAGELDPGETVEPIYQLFGDQAQDINLKLQIPTVAGDGAVDLTITDSQGGAAFTGAILDGETLWASVTLTPGVNAFTLHNTSGVTLTYELWLYELDVAPYAWSGVSRGDGTWQSHIQLEFPASGLYQFDFGATAGRYQFLVDDEYIQKTVEVSGTVSHYVAAGIHNLRIVQDSAAPQTNWSLDISGPGAGADTLPYARAGGNLGGVGNDFDTEWLPLKLDAAAEANFVLTTTGNVTDTLDVRVYGPEGSLISSVLGVFGGETLWWTADLPTGVSRIQLTAQVTNTGALTYDLTIHEKPTISAPTPTTWTGNAAGGGNNSQLRFAVSTAGLYDFSYDVTAGRYQFVVDSNAHIQKTVEEGGTVRYYLDAGDHTLTVVQDPAAAATGWSVGIAATGEAHDQLPYAQDGGNLGGVGNAFGEEWLPLELAVGETANLRLALTGDLGDGLRAYVYQGGTAVYTTPVVYGGETFWWTTDLAAGVNQLRLTAEGGNAAALQYDLAIQPIPTVLYDVPHTWSGLSRDVGGNSEIEVQMPVAGVYHVVVDIPYGFANVFITETNPLTGLSPAQSRYEFSVPLEEKDYLFQVWQSNTYVTTTWAITVSMEDAQAPQITTVNPATVTNEVSYALTIAGANFQPGAAVEMDSLALSPVTRLDSATLQAVVPAGVAVGVYDLTVTNPDSKTATLQEALVVTDPPPQVLGVTPTVGYVNAATLITITGQYFMATPQVLLGSQPLGSVTWVSAATLTAIVPAGLTEGFYDLTVINPDTQADTLVNAFQVASPPVYYVYLPIVTRNGP